MTLPTIWEYLKPFVSRKIRCIKVRLTGADGIGGTKTARYTEGFVLSRFDISKFTCSRCTIFRVDSDLDKFRVNLIVMGTDYHIGDRTAKTSRRWKERNRMKQESKATAKTQEHELWAHYRFRFVPALGRKSEIPSIGSLLSGWLLMSRTKCR